MRILYIVTAFPRSPGEIITPWMSETIDRLRATGTEVEVLAPSYRGLGDQVIDGTKVHRFRYAPGPIETLTHDQTAPDRLREKPYYAGLLPGYLLAGSRAATRLARTGRFDVLHAFWPIPHGMFALSAKARTGVPVVSTFFGVELTWMRRQLPFLAPAARWIVRKSDVVTAISSSTASAIQAVVPEARSRIIPFGAASSGAGDALPTRDVPLSEERDRPYRLLFVGRLVERKGVIHLLRALTKLDPGVRLAIVGDGPLGPSLRAAAQELGVAERVEFTGPVSPEELRRQFQLCDVFVLPAVEDSKGDVEGLGVVLIEALSHGRPVIASASGGIPDIVRDGSTGLLVTPGDEEALAGAVTRLRSDPELSRRLVAQGRAHIEEAFSWDHIVGELNRLYTGLAEGRTNA